MAWKPPRSRMKGTKKLIEPDKVEPAELPYRALENRPDGPPLEVPLRGAIGVRFVGGASRLWEIRVIDGGRLEVTSLGDSFGSSMLIQPQAANKVVIL